MPDEKCRGGGSCLLMICVVVVQVGLTFIAVQAGTTMKNEWMKQLTVEKVGTAKVFEVHEADFWGPVTAMVPTKCKINENWAKKVHQEPITPPPEASSDDEPDSGDMNFQEKTSTGFTIAKKESRRLADKDVSAQQQTDDDLQAKLQQDMHKWLDEKKDDFVPKNGVPKGDGLPEIVVGDAGVPGDDGDYYEAGAGDKGQGDDVSKPSEGSLRLFKKTQEAAQKKAAKEKAAKEAEEKEKADEKAEEAAEEKADEKAKEKAEKKAADKKAAREKADKEAAEKAEKEAADKKAAQEKAAKEAADKKAAKEKAAKEAEEKEKAAEEKADEKAEEKAEKKAADKKAAQEKAAKEAAEEKADEKADKEAAEKAEMEATDMKAAKEKADKEAADKKAAQEKAAKEAAEEKADEKAAASTTTAAPAAGKAAASTTAAEKATAAVSADLTAPVVAGATQLQVASIAGFAVGDDVQIADALHSETNKIKGFGSIVLQSPTQHSYAAGATVTKQAAVVTTAAPEEITTAAPAADAPAAPEVATVVRRLTTPDPTVAPAATAAATKAAVVTTAAPAATAAATKDTDEATGGKKEEKAVSGKDEKKSANLKGSKKSAESAKEKAAATTIVPLKKVSEAEAEAHKQNENRAAVWKKLNPPIMVEVCGQEREFMPPRIWNKYFSMVTLGRALHMGTPDNPAGLIEARVTTFNALLGAIAICMAVKYCLKFSDAFVRWRGPYYIKIWHNDRTRLDLVLESFMLHAMSTFFTLALQIALCSVFLAFWQKDHFVMTYVPKAGLMVFFVTMMIMTVYMVCDRVGGWLLTGSKKYFCWFWTSYILWCVVVAVPMVAYTIYSMNFNLTVASNGWMAEESALFSKEFTEAVTTARWTSYAFVLTALVDITAIVMHDLEKC